MRKALLLFVITPCLMMSLSGCFIIEGILGPKFTDEDSCEIVFVYYQDEYGNAICEWSDDCCGGGCGLSRRGENKRSKYQELHPERDYSVRTCSYTKGESPCELFGY